MIGRVETKLDWEGKRTQVEKIKLPFQFVETVNEPRTKTMDTFLPRSSKSYNMLIWGDNKLVMSSLLPEYAGKIKLIYIDPPFATGADFTLDVQIEDEAITKQASAVELKAYRDTWGQGSASYLQMLYDRLVLMRDLLTEDGSIFVHMDWHVGHYVKLLLDEIFGRDNFRNEIAVRRTAKHTVHQFAALTSLQVAYDSILLYSKTPSTKFNPPLREASERQKEGSWHVLYNRADRPTMRYPLLGRQISRGQWMWQKERAYAAVENYKEYEKKHSHDMTLKEYWELTGKKLEFVRANANTGEPEYWVAAKDLVPSDTDWSDIQAYSFNYHFPTEKSEHLLRRIIEMASGQGELVADFFAGSGTALAVAEKLDRRWIGVDLSKFAIHITRKRLLDIPACKPFQILNLGRYQKQKLIDNGNGGKRYIEFLLQLYNASPLQGFAYLHGRKADRLVHVGPIDSFVTLKEIRDVVREAINVNARGIDILGWDFEMGLHDLMGDVSKEYGMDIRLRQIPLEVLEIKAEQGLSKLEELRFYDLNYLDVEVESKGKDVTVFLKKFAIANPEYIPEEIRDTIKNFKAYIDYWAVDFDYKGDVFHNMRQEYRTRGTPDLRTRITYHYDQPGHYTIFVKVVDILGNDTNKQLTVRV